MCHREERAIPCRAWGAMGPLLREGAAKCPSAESVVSEIHKAGIKKVPCEKGFVQRENEYV